LQLTAAALQIALLSGFHLLHFIENTAKISLASHWLMQLQQSTSE
jgi:hypothetical protein